MAAVPGANSLIPADNVLMGVPKKGRLYDRCMKLLAGAGMDHRRVSVLTFVSPFGSRQSFKGRDSYHIVLNGTAIRVWVQQLCMDVVHTPFVVDLFIPTAGLTTPWAWWMRPDWTSTTATWVLDAFRTGCNACPWYARHGSGSYGPFYSGEQPTTTHRTTCLYSAGSACCAHFSVIHIRPHNVTREVSPFPDFITAHALCRFRTTTSDAVSTETRGHRPGASRSRYGAPGDGCCVTPCHNLFLLHILLCGFPRTIRLHTQASASVATPSAATRAA